MDCCYPSDAYMDRNRMKCWIGEKILLIGTRSVGIEGRVEMEAETEAVEIYRI